MRKGTKRKASHKEEATAKSAEETKQEATKSSQDSDKELKKAATGAKKRAKTAKPESEPEFFPEKRNMEDLWQQVFPVGTEWDQLDQVYQYKWNFSNLELSSIERFLLTGMAIMTYPKGKKEKVVSPFPPSDKIGINSVQREAEEILPMKQMKMDWVPYIPLENRASDKDLLLVDFYQPLKEDELEQSTVVQIMFPGDPNPVVCEFDWEFDELEEFVDKKVEEEEVTEDQKDAFKDFVKEQVREGKKANRQAREARRKALEEMSEEAKAAFENMKFYKFYPVVSPDTPDVSNVK
ncbi:hypothetical protein RJ640_015518, partial [Escallonia rubra]